MFKRGFKMDAKREVTIDIHGMGVIEAKAYLLDFLDSSFSDYDSVKVIHGFKGGSALLNMVRNELNSKHVKNKILTLNNGITILVLK